jgi:hypothetical protein
MLLMEEKSCCAWVPVARRARRKVLEGCMVVVVVPELRGGLISNGRCEMGLIFWGEFDGTRWRGCRRSNT